MDFLSSDEPLNFESLLVSYAEDNVIYLNSDFRCYITNVNLLLKALRLAKRQVNGRVKHRRCVCTAGHGISFFSVLVKHFANGTLFNYLLNGDPKELDNFNVDVTLNFPAFDIYDVITAYHKVRQLKDQLINARNVIVINPFLTLYDSDSDSGL